MHWSGDRASTPVRETSSRFCSQRPHMCRTVLTSPEGAIVPMCLPESSTYPEGSRISAPASDSTMVITSAPASLRALAYSDWSFASLSAHPENHSGLPREAIAMFSTPISCPMSPTGPSRPAHTATSPPVLLAQRETASATAAVAPSDAYSDASGRSGSGSSPKGSPSMAREVMNGGLSRVPRSTPQPRRSASAVMSKGTLTDSNPNSSRWAHPSAAIAAGSRWACGQLAPVASI